MEGVVVTLFVLIGIVLALALLMSVVPLGLWISAGAAGVKVGLFSLIGMKLRRVVPAMIIKPMIKATKAGIDVTINKLETHYLSGGNVDRVIDSLIAAQRADIPLVFEKAAAIDIAGRNVLEAVKMSVIPKVIETPMIAAIAKDGIELKALAKITVRANISRLIGGAGEQTIIARVGEGVVTTVGSAINHKAVLENPDMISKTVLSKGLDAGTAFEILSIDIADIDVGRNIGAQLQTDQAEADKKIAQAKAEERRAMAFAREQEMRALVEEMRAKVVEAEAEIPRAISEAFKKGQLGIMDYYNMKNVISDTDMRNSIAGMGKDPDKDHEGKK
ncbi:MAG: flotillin-like protein FloA [Clostridia bacterium]